MILKKQTARSLKELDLLGTRSYHNAGGLKAPLGAWPRSRGDWPLSKQVFVNGGDIYKKNPKAFLDFLSADTPPAYKKTKQKKAILRPETFAYSRFLFDKFFICCKESRIESPNSFYGCFYVGPFDESLSQTLALSIRRTLLSELSGLAITAVEIDRVLHKFSSLPGVQETVLDIICNLQNLAFKKVGLNNRNPSTSKGDFITIIGDKVAYLRERGPCIIKASDIILPPEIQCVNPDQHIATLAEDGVLNMKIYINEGKGFLKQKQKNLDLAEIKQRNLIQKNLQLSPITDSSENLPEADYFSNKSYGLNKQVIINNKKAGGGKATSFKSNKIFLDSVFMPVTKVNTIVQYSSWFEQSSQPEAYQPEATASGLLTDQVFVSTQPMASSKKVGVAFSDTLLQEQEPSSSSEAKSSDLNKKNTLIKQKHFFSFANKKISSASDGKTIIKNLPEVNRQTDYKKESLEAYLPLADTNNKNGGQAPLGAWHSNSLEVDSAVQPFILLSKNNTAEGLKQNRQCHIILEIWTNGSMHPREALTNCLEFLATTFVTLEDVKILGSMYKSDITYGKMFNKYFLK